MAHPGILQGRIGENTQRNQGEVVSRVSELGAMDCSAVAAWIVFADVCII